MTNKKGFTLIELILVILLMGIIAGFVGGILFYETDFFSQTGKRKENVIEKNLAMERMLKELKYAYRGYSSVTSIGNNLKFKTIFSYNGYTTVNIYRQGNQLLIKTNNGPTSVLADNVSYFNVTSVGVKRSLLRINIKIKKDDQEIEQQSEAFLRNIR